ncbi:hypothetical protein AWE51_14020 [Aquimarina aggregata]|uniref:Uncharacterized protein n=1 Tax=Aquimarina aggregata TaxID=1642818 RepID=A0A162XLR0_9FLAO|nr:hypothetical protein [Aquimarina aggregata]KZS38701.1 hypothetical protein AWE51_14020 [Aquimarina aggregata]
MNLEKLIKITNSEKYYQECDLQLIKIEHKKDGVNSANFNFIHESGDFNGITNVQKWQLTAHRCEGFQNMRLEKFMPYIQLKLFTDHPLLWRYNNDNLDCELIGYPKDIDTFLGQIYQTYIKVSNNWIQATEEFYATEYAYKKNGRKSLIIPENFKDSIEDICKAHDITFNIKTTIEQDNSKLRYLKVLVFGNNYISPDGFNIGQPYIIAHDFFVNKIYG